MGEIPEYKTLRRIRVFVGILRKYQTCAKRIPNYGQDLQEFIRAMEDNRESEQTQRTPNYLTPC